MAGVERARRLIIQANEEIATLEGLSDVKHGASARTIEALKHLADAITALCEDAEAANSYWRMT